MYAFVMRPESLPISYQDFIQKTGPVAEPVYKAVRDSCRGHAVDVASLHVYLSHRGKSDYVKLEEFPSIIPCSIIHPGTNSCLAHDVNATSATFKKTFPLYFSLTFVPFVVLRQQKVCSFQTIFVSYISANQILAQISKKTVLYKRKMCIISKCLGGNVLSQYSGRALQLNQIACLKLRYSLFTFLCDNF